MYLKWKEVTAPDFVDSTLTNLYNEGFVLTRKGRGEMDQTRSVRIDLSKFTLSSENRRVFKKTEELELEAVPLPYPDYTWQLGKLAKDFYEDKFGEGTFSANKIKELLTDGERSNFNTLLLYRYANTPIGYCITYQNSDILHYSYPFYDRATTISNLGLGMMLRAILYTQEQGKKYIYLGSAQRPTDIYKLQFAGLEWFDGKEWQTETEELKNILTNEVKVKKEIKNKKVNQKPTNKFLLFLLSIMSAFVLVFLTLFVSEQLTHLDIGGKGGGGNWACSAWDHYYECDFKELLKNVASCFPLNLIIYGIFTIPVSLIIYLVLTHRERIQK